MAEEADAVIIGGGPVGLTLAAELSYRGISAILIEKNHSTSVVSRAVAVNSRSMEHYRRLGLQEHIQDSSYPRDLPYGLYVGTSAIGGKTILHRVFSSWGDVLTGVPGTEFPLYQPGTTAVCPLFCPQSTLEPILKEHLETTADDIKMFWGWQATSLDQDETGVTIKAVQLPSPGPSDGQEAGQSEEKVFKAKYVIACYGGGGWGRKLLGVHTYGELRVVRVVGVTFNSPDLFTRMKEQGRLGFTVVINPKFHASLIMLTTNGDFALHLTLPTETPDEEIQGIVENVSQCIIDVIGENLPHTVVGVSSYYMHARMSTKYRVGRCLLVGDSSHRSLPAGGQVMNTGIGDAANLAWKLEAVLKGYGGPNLLDSYESERRALGDVTRRFALSFDGNEGMSPSIRALLISNPITRFFLGLCMKKVLLPQFTAGNNLILGVQYSNSGVVVHERDLAGNVKLSRSTDGCGKFLPSSLPGCHAPHVTLPDCASIIDLFGKTFVVLIIGGEETDLELLKLEMSKRGVPFETYSYPKLPELVACYDRKYFLVRPDGIIAWRSDCQPSTLESKKIVSTITGDVKPERALPQARPIRLPPPPTDLLDGVLSMTCTILLNEYTSLPVKCTGGIGLGVFWLLRGLRSASLPQSVQRVSRYHAVVQNTFGEADVALQIEPRFTGSFGPKDVLVRVYAASLNPLDIRMRQGYGAPMLIQRATANRKSFFPLVLGRDCSGEVVAVGDKVTKFLPGDQVFGCSPVASQGTHAQYVTLRENELAFKPSSVDHREAASLPWVVVATWTALVKHGGLSPENTRGKKILVHAGTGGVGSFAVQLLKAWGAEVTTTCSTRNIELAHRLGADKAIDYTRGDFSTALRDYDFVFNTVIGYEKPSLRVLKWFGNATYVSVINPRMFLITKLGAFCGQIAFSWLYRFKVITNRLFYGRGFFYSTAEPCSEALECVSKMVEKGEIRPLIDAVYAMDEIVAAHKHVEDRHTRGKVIVTMD